MNSMRINLMVSMENYMKSINLRQERKLSGLIDSFLTTYFNADKKYSDLFNAQITLEKESQEKEKELIKIKTKLVLINSQIKNQKEKQTEENKKEFEQVEKIQDAIKNSGMLDEMLR